MGCRSRHPSKHPAKGSGWSLLCFWVAAVSVARADCPLPADWESQPQFQEAVWEHVHDGDTVRLSDGRRVRLIGIDTPERKREERPSEPLSDGARDRLAALLAEDERQRLVLRFGADPKDRYRRVLAHVFTPSGENVTEKLLREGWGFQVVVPPNVWAADCYRIAEQQAAKGRKGVWVHPYFAPRQATDAVRLIGGFGRYQGRIARVTVLAEVTWVDLVGDISVRFDRDHRHYLRNTDFERLLTLESVDLSEQDWHLEGRGWLVDRSRWGGNMRELIERGKRKRWQLDVRHQLQWQLRPPSSR